MSTLYRYCIAISLIFALIPATLQAGNKDRSGQAGAAQLLINPWARSTGWGNAGMSNIRGLESIWSNVGGMAFTQKTDLNFSHTNWLKGSDINLISFGFAQRVSESGVLGLSVMSMNFGEIPITTPEYPDGGLGTFSPSLMNLSLAYAKSFSNSIHAGFVLKIISESISDLSAQGVAIDAGIQYITGAKENIHFGITLKNIGPTMSFSGDGLSIRVFIPGQETQFTLEQRVEAFELPTQLVIGTAYDFIFENEMRFTLAGNFTSNSFTKDQVTVGAEFSLKDYVQLRAGYTYEEGIWDNINTSLRSNMSKGPSAGISVQVPMNKEKGSSFAVDYSFRATDHASGTHSIGAKISF
ncbi:MAG: PorV/PorQ family protein [Bacteroidales bacterium]|nr:PorV/PorQ family protein [Bacteroidales bacterium]